jgi:hypothetical protein
MSEVLPEDRGIAAAVAAQTNLNDCPPCPLEHAKPSLASRVGRQLLRVLHDKRVDTELKVLAPVLIVRAVVYAGGTVETAKLLEQGLKALGV